MLKCSRRAALTGCPFCLGRAAPIAGAIDSPKHHHRTQTDILNACYLSNSLYHLPDKPLCQWASHMIGSQATKESLQCTCSAIFPDPILASALLDRLLHHALTINIRGNSYRLRDKLRLSTSSDASTNKEKQLSLDRLFWRFLSRLFCGIFPRA